MPVPAMTTTPHGCVGAGAERDERVVDDLPGAAQPDRLDHALQPAHVGLPVEPGQPVDGGVHLGAPGAGQPQRLLQRVADRVARAAQPDRLPVARAVGGEAGDGAARLGQHGSASSSRRRRSPRPASPLRRRPVGLIDDPHDDGAVAAAGPRLPPGQAGVDELRGLRRVHRLVAVLVALRALGEVPDAGVAAGAVQLGVGLQPGQVRLPPAALDDRVACRSTRRSAGCRRRPPRSRRSGCRSSRRRARARGRRAGSAPCRSRGRPCRPARRRRPAPGRRTSRTAPTPRARRSRGS